MPAIEDNATPTAAPAATENPRAGVSNWMSGLNEAAAKVEATRTAAAIAPPEPPKPVEPPPRPDTTQKPVESAKETPASKTDEDSEEKWPRTSDDWKKFKAKRKEAEDGLKVKLTDYEKKFADYETKMSKLGDIDETLSLKDKLAQIEKERAEYEGIVRSSAVEKHPQFKAYFDGKLNPRIEAAKEIAGEHGERIATLLATPKSQYRDSQIKELATMLEPYEQARLGGLVNEVDLIQAERNAEIAKSQENYQNMTQAEANKVKANQEKQSKALEKSFQDTVAAATDPKEGMFLFQKRENDAEWNKSVENRIQAAKNLMFSNTATPETIAKAAMYATALPDLLTSYVSNDKAQKDTIAKLEAQVKQLSAANPTSLPNGKLNGTPKSNERMAPLPLGARPMDASNAYMKAMHEAADQMSGR